MSYVEIQPRTETPLPASIKTEPKLDPEHVMRALEWHGKNDVRVVFKPRPLITEPGDAIVKITTSTVCGSDLHLYHGEVQGMQKGDILGHEFMGIVEAVGPEVKDVKAGDRVVVAFCIACGNCFFCKNGCYSCCDTTNPSQEMEDAYGQRISGVFGYSHITGGYPGGQAEYARVPLADINCLKVPDHLPDEKVLFLSDILCTGWHGNELAHVHEGDIVAIWGCGPVGLMTGMWAKFRGAREIIMIDDVQSRLDLARQKLGAVTIDFSKQDVLKTLKEMVPGGPDCCIDCVGFRYAKSLQHKVQRLFKLETDAPEVLGECIYACRKDGHIAIIGDYFLTANNFPIGPFMEKSLHAAGGQAFVQKYWKQLLKYIEEGKVDPTFVITHRMSLEQADMAYEMFDKHETLKIILKPPLIPSTH